MQLSYSKSEFHCIVPRAQWLVDNNNKNNKEDACEVQVCMIIYFFLLETQKLRAGTAGHTAAHRTQEQLLKDRPQLMS